MSVNMSDRRGFLGRVFGAAATASLAGAHSSSAQTRPASGAASGPDAWLNEVKGTHRCLFDFPQHKNGAPLLHILNYLNTYHEAYKAAPGTVGAVGTFYSIGTQSSIPLAFNDAMWAKYALGEYTGMKDASGKPYTRLSYSWVHEKDGQFRDEKPSQVAFEIEQMGQNVKLTVLHDDFAPDSKVFGMISNGWPMVLASLKSLLETGHALSTAKPECGQSLREKTAVQARGAA